MKMLGKIIGAILVCLVLALVVLKITGLDPKDRRPGLWLTGELVTTPIKDWSFVAQYPTDKVQTRSWYLLPHSVTTNFIVYNGQVYLTSLFAVGDSYPQSKSWTTNVVRDPHVRLKFGNQLFDCTLSVVTGPAEKAALFQAASKKYPDLMASSASSGTTLYLFHAVQ
jgi:hypothetical protein